MAPMAFRQANGLLVLGLIVLTGLGSGAIYYRYKQPQLKAAMEKELSEAPTTLEGRLSLWHETAAPMIHHRLTQVARLSDELPWLVTHAVERAEGDPEIWGLDVARLPRELSRLDGLTVIVDLPAPELLGHAPLVGDATRHVPVYGADETVQDPGRRLSELALWFLEGLPDALERDIDGSALEIRVAGSSPR